MKSQSYVVTSTFSSLGSSVHACLCSEISSRIKTHEKLRDLLGEWGGRLIEKSIWITREIGVFEWAKKGSHKF